MALNNIVVVPDLSETDLISLVHQKLKFSSLEPSFSGWSFFQDRKGNVLTRPGDRFEAVTWKPEKHLYYQRVLEHFAPLGAVGNTAALLLWAMQNRPHGHTASVLPEEAMWDSGDAFYVPCYIQRRFVDLSLYSYKTYWSQLWTFVAFRKIG